MKILVMSCSTGGGHNTAAKAIMEELERRGHEAVLLDPYELAHHSLDRKVGDTYIHLVQRTPSLFGMAYRLGEAYRHLPWRSPVYWVNGRMCSLMEEYLKHHSYDAIITTHLFPGEILTYMKNQGISVPETIFVATDYTCIPFTEEIDCDYYVIPSQNLAPDFASHGISQERLVPAGIPVRHAFGEKKSREELLRELQLAPQRHYLLLSGGSMGAGRICRMVEALKGYLSAHEDTSLIVICGSNQKLYERMQERFGEESQILLLQTTDRMAEYMKVCDVFLSKPGGLSSTEAAAAQVPLIHISPIPGCETKNMKYFSAAGMSRAVGNTRRALLPALEQLEDPKEAKEMKEKQREYVNPFAAAQICELVEQTAGKIARTHIRFKRKKG